jgi:hypothetical protein
MSARELAFIFVWALATAAAIAAPLSLIPALQPERKHIWGRFGYAFANWGLPAWCVIELLLWLTTHRWVP